MQYMILRPLGRGSSLDYNKYLQPFFQGKKHYRMRDIVPSQKGFITTSTIFIFLNAVSVVFELGFNWIVARLPGGGYGVYGRLFSIFFIITVPLLVVQLMVSKEVSSLHATGNTGQARYFIEQSLKYIIIGGLAITSAGLAGSRFIANLLSIESVAFRFSC